MKLPTTEILSNLKGARQRGTRQRGTRQRDDWTTSNKVYDEICSLKVGK